MNLMFVGRAYPYIGDSTNHTRVAMTVAEAKNKWLTAPADVVIMSQMLPDGEWTVFCSWLRERRANPLIILIANQCGFSLAEKAIRESVFRLLPENADHSEIAPALAAAREHLKKREEMLYSAMNRLFRGWRDGLKDSPILERYLVSGENLQEVFQNRILPEGRMVWLQRIRIPEDHQEYQWQDSLAQLMLMNIARQTLGNEWRIAPAVPMSNHICALFVWPADSRVSMEPEQISRQLFDLCREQMECTISVQTKGPLDVREAPQAWRSLSANDLPTIISEVGTSPSPETLMWKDILQGKQPKRLLNHLHKYIASRWIGYPPTQEELQQLYLQLIQAVDLAMAGKDFWAETLTDPVKYEQYIRGGTTLESFFAFANMTVRELDRLRNNPEITLTERIKIYIEEHMDQDIRCLKIAEEFKMSPDYLTRLFRRESGQALKTFILAQKMDYARHLLKLTRMPVSQVAERIGFINFAHFSAAYKKVYGETPTETRQMK